MAIAALNIAATVEYVSKFNDNYKSEGPQEPSATSFTLRALDSYMDAHVQSLSISYKTEIPEGVDTSTITSKDLAKYVHRTTDIYAMMLETVRLCLKGWKNFKDTSGNDLEFKTIQENIKGRMYDVVHPDLMARIPQTIVQELYMQINMLSVFSETDRKN
jgi:hypothetical protein